MPGLYPNLPDEDHIARLVPWARVAKDSDDNPIGILGAAFQLRENEEGLSVNWLERVSDDPSQQAIETIRLISCQRKVGSKARLAILNVGSTHQIALARNRKIRIIHAPIDGNEPHSEIRQFPDDDSQLLDMLATDGLVQNIHCGPLLAQLSS